MGNGIEVARDDPEWPTHVYRAIQETIPQASFGEELRIWPIASWLDGHFVHVVYRKRGFRGVFGFRFDTRHGITGSDWPEPETIGREIVMYGLWEPHEEAPEEYLRQDRIYWRGDLDTDLPQWMHELPADGA